MTAFSNCIRSTPGRTLGALLIAAFSLAGQALRHQGESGTLDGMSDQALADIGLSRGMLFDGSAAFEPDRALV